MRFDQIVANLLRNCYPDFSIVAPDPTHLSCVFLLFFGEVSMCASLNVFGPHKHVRSGSVRKCCLVGGSVALLEEM